MVMMGSRQLLFFAGRDEGAEIQLFWKEKIQEICFQTWFKYAMEMTFG
jgi:hypothetical protein